MPNLTRYQITKVAQLLDSKSIADISAEFKVTPVELRAELTKHNIQIKRGRKRGDGTGRMIDGTVKKDRRVAYQERMMKDGRCTGCGKKNDSDSLYHCKACLKKRAKQKADKRK